MSTKDGFDNQKRWGNSAQKGHGANSPAMMEARKSFSKKEVAKKMKSKPKKKFVPDEDTYRHDDNSL